MKIIYYGGRQAGAVCLLSILARGDRVSCAIPQDEIVKNIAKEYRLAVFSPKSINSEESEKYLRGLKADLFVCVHGRQIVKKNILGSTKMGGINVHPCLYKYKGANPVERMLSDGETRASVGVHRMVDEVDAGEILEELFIDVAGCKSAVEVYNALYPLYAIALKKTLDKLDSGNISSHSEI